MHPNTFFVSFQVLLEESTRRVPAALHGLAVFVDTLRLLVDAQRAVATAASSPRHSPSQPSPARPDSATPMEEDSQPDSQLPEGQNGRLKKEAGADASSSPKVVSNGQAPRCGITTTMQQALHALAGIFGRCTGCHISHCLCCHALLLPQHAIVTACSISCGQFSGAWQDKVFNQCQLGSKLVFRSYDWAVAAKSCCRQCTCPDYGMVLK